MLTAPFPGAWPPLLPTGWSALDESARVQRGMWLHATLPRPPVGQTPHEVIHRQNKLEVRWYPARRPGGQAVVIVPSLINRAWIVDLEPERSLVGGLSALGHDVYLIDWGIPGPEDARTTVDDVVLDLLRRSVDRVRRHARRRPHLLGYCQGGTLAAMYAALLPDTVEGLAVFNAPFRFSEGGRFQSFVQDLDLNAVIDPDRLVPVDLMKIGFKLLDPMGNWTKFLAVERDAHDPRRLARTLARERWLEENVPLPGTFALEFIRRAYQDDALLDGAWQVGGQTVDLRRWEGPLLVVASKRDFIAPPASVLPLARATGSRKVREELLNIGHIGVVVGGFGPAVFYPLLDEWFREASA